MHCDYIRARGSRLNYDQKRAIAKDVSEMVRLGQLVAYCDVSGVVRLVRGEYAKPDQLRKARMPHEVYWLILSPDDK